MNQPRPTIREGNHTMRLMLSLALLGLFVAALPADEKKDDTPKAARTRKVLEKKISVDFEDLRLEDALEEIKDFAPGFTYKLDTKGGVSRNSTVTFVGKNKTVAEVLDGMFKKKGLGYYVISNKANAYDGVVWIKQGDERGYPKKKD